MPQQEDRAAIRSIHEARGCPAESGVGQYFRDILDAPITPENEHPGLARLRRMNPVGYIRFCTMAGYLDWPEGDASFLLLDEPEVPEDRLAEYQAFWLNLGAMQDELTRLMKEF